MKISAVLRLLEYALQNVIRRCVLVIHISDTY